MIKINCDYFYNRMMAKTLLEEDHYRNCLQCTVEIDLYEDNYIIYDYVGFKCLCSMRCYENYKRSESHKKGIS